jgi:hypothetical protein
MLDILNINEYKNTSIYTTADDVEDNEFISVVQSNTTNLKLPNIFINAVFKSIYGVNIENVLFKNKDCLDWEYSNIIFNPLYRS